MKRSPFHRASAGLQIVAAANDEVEIMLYDEIGFWGVTASEFNKQLSGIKAKTINLRVNSPGGDVFDGIAIYNALRDHPARVVTHIDGVAASIASVIALAGDEVRMAENAFMMIHNAWGMVIGYAEDMRKEADLLDKVSGSLLMAYENKTTSSSAEIQAWMDDETWFTAEEAAEAGFVDEITRTESQKALASIFDLSAYQHVPAALLEEHEPSIREIERALRDVGLSQIAAKAFVAAGRAADSQRDAENEGEAPRPVPFVSLFGI